MGSAASEENRISASSPLAPAEGRRFRRRSKRPAVVAAEGVPTLSRGDIGGASGVLSAYEFDALRMLADGRSRAEIADTLGITLRSARDVCRSLHCKLGANHDVHAVAIGFRRGLLPLDRRGGIAVRHADKDTAETADGQAHVK
jgi:DNA-binding CsgD family transcriptional regulator